MSSLKSIRKRIHSIEGICKITSAMSLLSTSKLRSFQHLKDPVNAYVKTLENIMGDLASLDRCPPYYRQTSCDASQKTLWIIITANKGFCGGFLGQIFKDSMFHILENDEAWVFGERGKLFFKKSARFFSLPSKFHSESSLFSEVAGRVIEKIRAGDFQKVGLVHATMKNIMSYPTCVQILFPLQAKNTGLLLEPNTSDAIERLAKEYLALKFYSACVENANCEHAARMLAMDLATRNTKELIQKLRLTYNKTRQNMITNELIEIVGGAD
jgi:F-type H+-transporting ATPase subunit gamma